MHVCTFTCIQCSCRLRWLIKQKVLIIIVLTVYFVEIKPFGFFFFLRLNSYSIYGENGFTCVLLFKKDASAILCRTQLTVPTISGKRFFVLVSWHLGSPRAVFVPGNFKWPRQEIQQRLKLDPTRPMPVFGIYASLITRYELLDYRSH